VIFTLLKAAGFSVAAWVIDAIYLLIIVAVLGGSWLYIHSCHVAHEQLANIHAQSKQELKTAKDQIKDLTEGHAAAVAEIADDYEKQMADAKRADAFGLQRVQNAADAYRRAHPLLGCAGSPSNQPGTDKWAEGFDRLGRGGAELAAALRADDAKLIECRRERDKLTGKGGISGH